MGGEVFTIDGECFLVGDGLALSDSARDREPSQKATRKVFAELSSSTTSDKTTLTSAVRHDLVPLRLLVKINGKRT